VETAMEATESAAVKAAAAESTPGESTVKASTTAEASTAVEASTAKAATTAVAATATTAARRRGGQRNQANGCSRQQGQNRFAHCSSSIPWKMLLPHEKGHLRRRVIRLRGGKLSVRQFVRDA
jgi:hypothetical protein